MPAIDHQTHINATITCATVCEQCSQMCLKEGHEHSAITTRDCAQICWTTAAFLARDGTALSSLCKLCAEICDICAQACEMHDSEHHRQCVEACRACAKACRDIDHVTPRTPSGERL